MKKHPDALSDRAKYEQGWVSGGKETPCGFGSRVDQTELQRHWLPQMFRKYDVTSVADLGAGDLNWIRFMPMVPDYYPYDLFPRHHDVEELDILHDDLPVADCYMLLWVLNHFPPEAQCLAMRRILDAAPRILIMTWDILMEPCTDLGYSEMITLRRAKDGRNLDLRLIEL